LVLVIAAVVIVSRLVGSSAPIPGSFGQPHFEVPTVGPSAGDDGQTAETASAAVDHEQIRAAASTFTEIWLRRSLSADAWHAALAPLCTQTLAQSLTGVDPSGVPATRMVGEPTVTLRSDVYALVTVPVDSGTVELGLLTQGGRWLVDTLDWQRT
jgi:hypothetical protein